MDIESLIKLTADDIGLTKVAVRATLTAAFKVIRGTVASGEKVRLPELGTFEARNISDGDQRNPQAGDPVDDVIVVKFSPAIEFRKEVNHRS